MDYEKSYKEALDRAKKLIETCDSTAVIGWCEHIFPVLKESKKEWIEKIRQELKSYLGHRKTEQISESDAVQQWITWLEKQGQGEQRIAWSEEDDKRINRIYDFLWKHKRGFSAIIWQIEEDANWLKSLKERVQSNQGEQKSMKVYRVENEDS